MNIDAKTIKKISKPNQITHKKSYTMTTLDLSQGHKDDSTYTNHCDTPHQQQKKTGST